jgi:hypothetical protein
MVESTTVMVPLLEIPPPKLAEPPVTVRFSSITGKLAPSLKVVPLLSPLSTLEAEEADPVPLPSIVRLASLPPLRENCPSNVQAEVVHEAPELCTSSMVTASPL